MRVPVSEQFTEQVLHEHDVVLDGIFGFSFKGEVRAPFDTVLKVRAGLSITPRSRPRRV